MPPTRSTVFTTDSPNRYKALHALRWSRTIRDSTGLLHTLRLSQRTLRASASLLHDLRWLTLHASYTLHGGQNGLSKLLQTSYVLCCGQNGLTKTPTRFAVVKTVSPNFNKPSTCFADVKINSPVSYTL